MVTHRHLAAFVLAASSTGLMACGANDSVSRDDLDDLTERISELERTNGRLRVRLQDTEERIFLLQDRVEANRINSMRRQTASYDRTRQSFQTAPTHTQRFESPVTSSAPPPFPDINPLVPELPVQRLAPDSANVELAPLDEEPELVIDMAAYEARFGDEPGGSRPRQASTAPSRRALPPVDVGHTRLQVVPVDSSNRALVPTVAAPEPSEETPLSLYRSALDQFNGAEYTTALQSLNQFVAAGPEPDYMDNALFWMGECYYGLGRYDEALGFFQRVVSEYPDGNKVPDSLLKVALTYERLDNRASAREVLNVLVDTYPTTDAATRASERLRALE